MRIAILGSGAVGGLYGGLLARAGVEVHFLMRSDADHVRQHGLTVDSVWGDFHLPSVNVHTSFQEMPKCDVAIVTIKSTANSILDRWLPAVVADDGVVLTLQNGLNIEDDCCRTLPKTRVLGGCCFLCSNKVGPGHIRHIDYGRVVFGTYENSIADVRQPAEQTGRELVASMVDAGIPAEWTDNLYATRWRKLMWNIPFNGLSVVLDASTDQIMNCRHARALAETIITEVHLGAGACGVTIDPAAIEATLEHTETMKPYDSSMRLDDRFKREMEVEAIFGNPLTAVREATGREDMMPRVSMLYQQLSHRNYRNQCAIADA